jgi:hypothetical protein
MLTPAELAAALKLRRIFTHALSADHASLQPALVVGTALGAQP